MTQTTLKVALSEPVQHVLYMHSLVLSSLDYQLFLFNKYGN